VVIAGPLLVRAVRLAGHTAKGNIPIVVTPSFNAFFEASAKLLGGAALLSAEDTYINFILRTRALVIFV
jgi:hypothetical protein